MSKETKTNHDKQPSFVPTIGNLKNIEKSFEKARIEIKKKKI